MKFASIIDIDTDGTPDSVELRQAELNAYELYNNLRRESNANAGGFVAYSNAIRAPGSRIRQLLAMLTLYCRFDYISSTDYSGQDLSGLSYTAQKDLIGKGITSLRSCYICGSIRPVVKKFYTTGDADETTPSALGVFGVTSLASISQTEEGLPLMDKAAKESGLSAEEWLGILKSEMDERKDILVSVTTSTSIKGSDWSNAFRSAVAHAKSLGYTFVNPSGF